jgi:hypothetical protein
LPFSKGAINARVGVMTESSQDPTLRCPIGSPAKEPEWAPQLF